MRRFCNLTVVKKIAKHKCLEEYEIFFIFIVKFEQHIVRIQKNGTYLRTVHYTHLQMDHCQRKGKANR